MTLTVDELRRLREVLGDAEPLSYAALVHFVTVSRRDSAQPRGWYRDMVPRSMVPLLDMVLGKPPVSAPVTLPQSEHDDLTRLGIIYAVLAPDARLVLMRLANRLEQGQRQYGNLDLARDVRDWLEEQQQERLDELVYGEIYLAAQDVRRGEAGR